MNRSLLALAASSFLVLGATGCAGESTGGDEAETTTGDAQLNEKPKQSMLWTKAFPVAQNGAPAPETPSDVHTMNGCKYTAVKHFLFPYQAAVGIKVQAETKFSCPITNALGGTGYLALGVYPSPVAYARLDTYAPLDRIAFTSNGAQGAYGPASNTLPTLSVKLIQAGPGTIVRSISQGTCGGGTGAKIVPTGTISVDPSTGTFSIGGTKNEPSGLLGDGCIGGGPFLTNFTLHYADFAAGSGPVSVPTID